jgi:predicted transcriptional regulator
MLIYMRKQEIKEYLFGPSVEPSPISHSFSQSAVAYPPYWGTLEGEIIKAVVSAGRPLTWKEIQKQTNGDQQSLNNALSNLFDDDAITKIENTDETTYKVSYYLFKSYKNQLRLVTLAEGRKGLEDWINQWKSLRNLNFSLDHEHFFLEGRHLDDFSKELISHAKLNVLVINPFIKDCDLSNTLSDAKKKGVDVRIITRQPQDKYTEYLEKNKQYLSRLQTGGIELTYNNKVHAKIIVVDNSIAIISSMNFYPESSAGALWEAGLITIQTKTVESILESIKTKAM